MIKTRIMAILSAFLFTVMISLAPSSPASAALFEEAEEKPSIEADDGEAEVLFESAKEKPGIEADDGESKPEFEAGKPDVETEIAAVESDPVVLEADELKLGIFLEPTWFDLDLNSNFRVDDEEVDAHLVGHGGDMGLHFTSVDNAGDIRNQWSMIKEHQKDMFRIYNSKNGANEPAGTVISMSPEKRVGINTYNPTTTLDINGSVRTRIVRIQDDDKIFLIDPSRYSAVRLQCNVPLLTDKCYLYIKQDGVTYHEGQTLILFNAENSNQKIVLDTSATGDFKIPDAAGGMFDLLDKRDNITFMYLDGKWVQTSRTDL